MERKPRDPVPVARPQPSSLGDPQPQSHQQQHGTEPEPGILHATPRYRSDETTRGLNLEQGLMVIYVIILAYLIFRLLRVYLSRLWTSITARTTTTVGHSDKKAQ
jgi:hypothetical protein